MFERYTENARRVVFWARYEASQYGDRYIHTEHLVLGLLGADRALAARVMGPNANLEMIRAEIEESITKGERISTKGEIPLSPKAKEVLLRASEEAGRLKARYVGTEHILLAILQVEGALARRILARLRVTEEEALRQLTAELPQHRGPSRTLPAPPLLLAGRAEKVIAPLKWLSIRQAEEVVTAFLCSFKTGQWTDSAAYLADHVRFIDAAGNRWAGHGELHAQFERLFSSYANPNASFVLESASRGPGGCVIANILWDGVANPGEASGSRQRMTVIIGDGDGKSLIFFVQVTPIQDAGGVARC